MADNGSVVCVANRGALVVKTMGSKHDSRNSLPNSPKATIRRQNNADNTFINNKQKPGSAAVIVVKDGNILTGIRKSEFAGGLLCGAGGHVEEGETLKQTAARECKEEFGITPKGMIQLGYGAWEPDTGLKPAIFLCTDYEGEIVDESSEMEEIKFRSLSEINEMSKLTFQPFKDSLEMMVSAVTGKQEKKIKTTIDKTPADVTIKADEGIQQLEILELIYGDGGEGSGNFGHAGNPGNVGGSAPAVSGSGVNKFSSGFSKSNLQRHWSEHKKEYPNMTKSEYSERALELIQMPIGGNILGYKNSKGQVIRYDKSTNDFVKGNPSLGIATMFKPKKGEKYFNNWITKEGIKDEE